MILGIDIGTTNVKCIIYNSEISRVVFDGTIPHHASKNIDSKREQDVSFIVAALQDIIGKMPMSLRQSIRKISICGQMHGVCLWNTRCWHFDAVSNRFSLSQEDVYNLITWEDGRCDSAFLQALPKSDRDSVSSGFGCATLCWLSLNDANVLKKYNCAGTIMDFVVCMLTGCSVVTTSTQLANSWGYFNKASNQWQKDALSKSFSDVLQLLPMITEPGKVVGKLNSPWLGIASGVDVFVALGDFQCSVLAAEKHFIASPEVPTNVVFNFGTGCQLACPMSSKIMTLDIKNGSGLSIWPYFRNEKPVAVAATLNGGNVLSHLVTSITDLLASLNVAPPSESHIWSVIKSIEFNKFNSFSISPLLFGERHCPDASLSVLNVTSSTSLTMPNILSSLSLGIVQNVLKFYPPDFFNTLPNAKVICVGKAFRLPVMQGAVKHCFANVSIEFVEEVNSAVGAALSVE